MMQGNFQFNNTIINEILNFATSSYDLLFLSGPEGNAKSETIEHIMPKLSVDNLVFRHFCFENSVIDDFLLNFYDGLRDFSVAKKISLKKFASDDFKEKVMHYLKVIQKKSVIIIENFEKVQENFEIIDFLTHIANYPNIKIIIVSKEGEKNLFRFRSIKTKTLLIEQSDKKDFEKKLENIANFETIQKFYNISKGREFFLEMTLKLLSVNNLTLKELVDEFERKNENTPIDFEEFLVTKFIYLTPKIYTEMFRVLCLFNHPVSLNFINSYNLGNVDYISYLSKNFLINFFKDEIYVKDCFKKYISSGFSNQEKLLQFKKFVEIFENELTKSPAQRLLRLSRESIRKEMENYKKQIPLLNSAQNKTIIPVQNSIKQSLGQNFTYFRANINKKEEDKKKESILKLSQKLKKIKEKKETVERRKPFLFDNNNENENEKREKIRNNIIEKINSSRILSKNYEYKEAIQKLLESYKDSLETKNEDLVIETILLAANNYEHLNDFSSAKKYYTKAYEKALESNDLRKTELSFKIALCNKNLFRENEAIEQFSNIIQKEDTSDKYKAMAYMEIAEIYESLSKPNEAKNSYLSAIPYVIGQNKKLASRCYFKLGLLYDENNDVEKAIQYYQKNYTLTSSVDENKYYSISLNNLALIYFERGDYESSLKFLKMALSYDIESNNAEDIYLTQKELAKVYSKIDENEMENYYNQALENADKLNDAFKKALVYFEKGEYYYDKYDDKKAYENFLRAKEILKNSDDENMKRINTRIKDIEKRKSYGN